MYTSIKITIKHTKVFYVNNQSKKCEGEAYVFSSCVSFIHQRRHQGYILVDFILFPNLTPRTSHFWDKQVTSRNRQSFPHVNTSHLVSLTSSERANSHPGREGWPRKDFPVLHSRNFIPVTSVSLTCEMQKNKLFQSSGLYIEQEKSKWGIRILV